MTKSKYGLVGAIVGLVLGIMVVLIPILQQTPHSFAAPATAGATATAKAKGKGPAVGASASFTDYETGLQDMMAVSARANGTYTLDVDMPRSSSALSEYARITFGDPYSSSARAVGLLSFALGTSSSTLKEVPIASENSGALARQDQLNSGQNSSERETFRVESNYYHDGYVSRIPYPVTPGAITQWQIQVYDRQEQRLRNMIVNEVPENAGLLSDLLPALNNQINAEKALQAALLPVGLGALAVGILNSILTQPGSVRTLLPIFLAVGFILNAFSAFLVQGSAMFRYHQAIFTTYMKILAGRQGSPHELAPVLPGATPTPTH